jgi:hypothetical protein
MNIRPERAEFSMLKEGRTDRHELIVAFRKFANAPEKRLLGRPGVRRRLALK